jgi:hypothetical protein
VFVLRRPSSEAPYRVDEFAESFGDALAFEGQFDLYAHATTKFLGATLLERMRSPSFVVKAVDSATDDRGELVRFAYTCDRETSREEGSVSLSPALHWAIVEVDVNITTRPEPSSQLKATYRMRYDALAGPPPVPGRIEYVVKSMRLEGTQHDLVEYEEIVAGDPPADMFKLSAYGLPDIPIRPKSPPSVSTPTNPLLWGSLAVAGACFVLLAVLRARDQRKVPG